ncbi:MAG: hypothetical protein HQL96_12955 [Magnetococcales bacterium]|nr:hypothetical protein [Magnetococcales bacterium]
MIKKMVLAGAGILAMAVGFVNLLKQSDIVHSLDPHKPDITRYELNLIGIASQKAVELTWINLGVVIVGGILILTALFAKPPPKKDG